MLLTKTEGLGADTLAALEARLARINLRVPVALVPSKPAELAARLGTMPDVLSRALRILAEAGLIRFDRRQITILDRPGLLQRAQLVP